MAKAAGKTHVTCLLAVVLALLAIVGACFPALADEAVKEETIEQDSDQAEAQDTESEEEAEGADALIMRKLADGNYTLKGKMLQPDKKTVSMANKGVKHKVALKVSNGTYYLTLTLISIDVGGMDGYLGTMKRFKDGYKVNAKNVITGKTASVKVLSYQKNAKGKKVKDDYGTNYPKKVRVKLIEQAKKDGYVPLQVFTPLMEAIAAGNGTKTVFLKLDLSTLAKASASSSGSKSSSSSAKSSSKTEKSTKSSKSKKKSKKSSSSNKTSSGKKKSKTSGSSSKSSSRSSSGGTSLSANTLQPEEEDDSLTQPPSVSVSSSTSKEKSGSTKPKLKKTKNATAVADAFANAPVLDEVDDSAFQNSEIEGVEATVDAAQATRVVKQVEPQPPLKRYIPVLIAVPVVIALAAAAYAAFRRRGRVRG